MDTPVTVADAFRMVVESILITYDEREAQNIAKILLADKYNESASLLSIKPFAQYEELKEDISKINRNIPIQHIVGRTNFFGYNFKVNKHVLIPRPETEELVFWILEDHSKMSNQVDLIDIGTGSGCIPIALSLKRKNIRIFGVDYSLDALNVARINSKKLKQNIQLLHFNFLDHSNWDQLGRFDIIVSNPPYISEDEKSLMVDNVLLYEPEMALFVPNDDPLIFYKAIISFSNDHLKSSGSVYVELNENYANETRDLFEEAFKHVEIRSDLQGKQRMLKASNN